MFKLQQATRGDFERLFKIRSTVPVWTGKLTVDQYIERTRRIFDHSFARRRIETWMLLDSSSDALLCSMDVLSIEILKAMPGEAPQFAIVPLISSLVTAPELRCKGYASQLMSLYCDSRKDEIQVLYSNIHPSYYTKFRFHDFPIDEIETPVSFEARVNCTPSSVALEPLIQGLRNACLNRAHTIESPSVINLPTALFMDWHLERYRFVAECANREMPRDLYWKLPHSADETEHFIAAAPDFLQGRLDCLWITPDCGECTAFASTLAREWGLDHVRYWSRSVNQPRPYSHLAGSHACVPMLRAPEDSPRYRFLDPQICTWF